MNRLGKFELLTFSFLKDIFHRSFLFSFCTCQIPQIHNSGRLGKASAREHESEADEDKQNLAYRSACCVPDLNYCCS